VSRVFLGAFGDPGHAFPMLALGAALARRGHAVCLQTWQRWEAATVAAGVEFSAAPEYQVFPTRDRPMKPYQAAVHAARATVPAVEAFGPDYAVSDILTPAPALAAELAGVPVATLVPHGHPHQAPGFPIYSIGARLPRTIVGRVFWRRASRVVERGLEQGRVEYNECRARLGLGPLPWVHTGLSRELTLVGTLPQLEYPRDWPSWARVVGPLQWELPGGERVSAPAGEGPVVLVAPSTAQDGSRTLLRAALAGLADAPVRVIAAWGEEVPADLSVPANAVVIPWMSYAKTMPDCDVVITHGGHGTLVRALTCGCPVVVCPAGGDMAENAARVDWARLGVRLPPLYAGSLGVRLAVERALTRRGVRENVDSVARWAVANDGAERAVDELEAWWGRR
jgi:UDP:flavonoid glycosyltransferase YjiC (YdhE family)